ncbi:MAG: hypothetical protein AAGA45_01085, partial [Verrucomicrobiota bacterium]
MKNTLFASLLALLTVPLSGSIIVQVFSPNADIVYFDDTDFGNTNGQLGSFSTDFNQFDPALGTLDTFTLTWDFFYTVSFTVADGESALAQAIPSGSFSIGGISYTSSNGFNSVAGSGSGTGTFYSANANISSTFNFVGGNYNPSINGIITGTGTYQVALNSAGSYQFFSTSGGNLLSGSAFLNAN